MSTQSNEFKSSLDGLAEGKHDPHDYLALIEDLSSSNSTQDPGWAIQHAKEIAASENPQAKIQQYVELVLSTRTKVEDDHELDTKLVTAASNAISILNYGSLLGLFDFQMVYVRDWSRCRFPEADLSFAALRNCVFDDADLSRVTLWGANLYEANLKHSNHSHASPALMHPEVESTFLGIIYTHPTHPADPCTLPGWVSSDGKILLKALNPVAVHDYTDVRTYKSLEVWDLTEQKVLFTSSHGNFSCAALSPNGSVLVYAESVIERADQDAQPNLHVYEVVPGERAITTISVPFAKVPDVDMDWPWYCPVVEVRNATFNRDGSKLAVVSLAVASSDYHGICDFCCWKDYVTYRSLIVILDARNGFNVTAEIPVDGRVTSVVFSQDSSLLVCTTEKRVMCWNTDGWECKCNQGYDEDVACVGFVPYAAQLSVVLKNGSVHVCDLVETVSDPIPTTDDGSYTAPTSPGEGKDDADERSMEEYPSVSAAQLRKLFEQDESCAYVIIALATSSFDAAPRFGIDVWKFLQGMRVELPFPHESLVISPIRGTTEYFHLSEKAQFLNRAALCDLLRSEQRGWH